MGWHVWVALGVMRAVCSTRYGRVVWLERLWMYMCGIHVSMELRSIMFDGDDEHEGGIFGGSGGWKNFGETFDSSVERVIDFNMLRTMIISNHERRID